MITEGQILPYETSGLFAGPWLVMAPHADDETFGMGGAILKATAASVKVHLLIMTDGALGGTADDLVSKRQQEARQAAEMLGVTSVSFLGEQDRTLSPDPELCDRVLNIIEELQPATVFFPSVFEPHPDHRATALIAWQALQQMQENCRPDAVAYEIIQQSQVNTLIDISQQMDRKIEVMRLYLSQVTENNYIQLSTSMSVLRTFTLPDTVSYAEGYYRYSKEEMRRSLSEIACDRIAQSLSV